MSYNVTIEVLDAFSKRLHINTALNVFVNIPTAYLILFHSSKAMGFYKYYLLYTVVTTFVMDIHQTVIHGVYVPVPSMINCCSGYCRHFGMFWGPELNYLIVHVNISVVGTGLVSLGGYRYLSIFGDAKRFESKYSLLGIFIFGILYPVPALMTLIFGFIVQPSEEIISFMIKDYPGISSLAKTGICSAPNGRVLGNLYGGVIGVQMALVQGFGFFLVFKTVTVFKILKNSLSPDTYAAQKQLMLSMILQIMTPLLTLIIPISVVMILHTFRIEGFSFASEIAVHIMTLHAPLNGLAIILTIKPYKDALKKLIIRKPLPPQVQLILPSSTAFTLR